MKHLLSLLMLFISVTPIFGQQADPYALRFPDDYETVFPTNYSYVEGSGVGELHLFADFNGDKKEDLACILTHDQTGETILFIELWGQSYYYCDWGVYSHHDITFQKGVLKIFSDSGAMGVYGMLNLKYDKVKKQMIIISSEGVKNVKFKKWKPIVG